MTDWPIVMIQAWPLKNLEGNFQVTHQEKLVNQWMNVNYQNIIMSHRVTFTKCHICRRYIQLFADNHKNLNNNSRKSQRENKYHKMLMQTFLDVTGKLTLASTRLCSTVHIMHSFIARKLFAWRKRKIRRWEDKLWDEEVLCNKRTLSLVELGILRVH